MAKVIETFGADISTDDIYPGRYMATVLPTETPEYCFADRTELSQKLLGGEVPPGSILVGGENFGCGSSREQAASALKGYDPVIVAKSIARIFLQNAINLGLRVVICPEIEATAGDELTVTPEAVINESTGKRYAVEPLPPSRQAIIDAGGLIAYTRARVTAG